MAGRLPGLPRDRDVVGYYAYKATSAVELYRPVMYLYFLAVGLSFTEIAILEVVYNLVTVGGEVPTGYVGDRVGRRASLLLGTALIALTLVGIGLAGSFGALAVLYGCWSLGYAFRSGSEDAWLYDTLAADRSAEAFARVRGRGDAVALLTGVGGAVAGGYLGGIDLAYPFFAAAGVTALGLLALIGLSDTGAGGDATPGFVQTARIAVEAMTDRGTRAFVGYYFVLFAAVTYLVFVFLQPVFRTVAVGAGLPAGAVEPALGWFYAGYSLLGALLSFNAGAIEARVGLRTWFAVVPLALGGALAASTVVPVLVLPTLLAVRGLADVTRTLAAQYVNDRTESVGRATVLSAMAMVSAVAVVPVQLAAGALADATSPLAALGAGGLLLLVGSAVLLRVASPVVAAGRPS